jgi:hypothetical protein
MTVALIEPNTWFKSTNWSLPTRKNSSFVAETRVIAIEDVSTDSTTESRRFLQPELPVEPTTAEQVTATEQLLFAAPSGLAVNSISALQPNISIILKASCKESAADTPLTAAPDTLQAFFQRAESRLSAETEITAQYALKLLRRVRELVVKICPKNLQGRMLAMVDKEDGSTTIEWIRNQSRLGFVLDREDESSWFVVLPNGLSKSGYLYRDSGLKSLRGLLEEFIAAEE